MITPILLNKPINYRVISQCESSCDVIIVIILIIYSFPYEHHDVPGPQLQPWIAVGWEKSISRSQTTATQRESVYMIPGIDIYPGVG